MNRIRIIINKEWAEVFKNRLVVFTTIFMPLILTILPLVLIYFTRDADSSEYLSDLPSQFETFCADQSGNADCIQYYLLNQFIILFMLTPVIIPVNIAAYSIVGEKTTRSLEPLLATPISTIELLLGKNLAAATPAVLATWIGYIIFAIGAYILSPGAIVQVILDPLWLIAIFIVSPLLAILAVNFAIMVSSRVNDPRVAEQLSVVVILPLLLLMFGQIAGVLVINRQIILLLAVVVLIVNIALTPLTVRLFQRETILTRWK